MGDGWAPWFARTNNRQQDDVDAVYEMIRVSLPWVKSATAGEDAIVCMVGIGGLQHISWNPQGTEQKPPW